MTVQTEPGQAATAAEWTPATLKEVSDRYEARPPEEILRWGMENFAPDIALATSFGPQSIVLAHLIAQIDPRATVFYLDTDLLFPETYASRDELAARLGLNFTRVHGGLSLDEQAAEHGPELWVSNPDQCCFLRKVQPLRCFLATQRAWITGVRRDHARVRANVGLVEWDSANGLTKLNPLAAWSTEQVWYHIYQHELPFNRLHMEGYPSIGCMPCTRPIAPGEDARAGRWSGQAKTECGIHLQPQSTEQQR